MNKESKEIKLPKQEIKIILEEKDEKDEKSEIKIAGEEKKEKSKIKKGDKIIEKNEKEEEYKIIEEDKEFNEANSLKSNTAGGCLGTLQRLVNFLNYNDDGKKIMQNLADEIVDSAKEKKPTKTVNNSSTKTKEEKKEEETKKEETKEEETKEEEIKKEEKKEEEKIIIEEEAQIEEIEESGLNKKENRDFWSKFKEQSLTLDDVLSFRVELLLEIIDKIVDGSYKNTDPINVNNDASSTGNLTLLKDDCNDDLKDESFGIFNKYKMNELKGRLASIIKSKEDEQTENEKGKKLLELVSGDEDETGKEEQEGLLLLLDKLIVPNKLERSIINSLAKFDTDTDFNNLLIKDIKLVENNRNFQDNKENNVDDDREENENEDEYDGYNGNEEENGKKGDNNNNTANNTANDGEIVYPSKNEKIRQQIHISDFVKICKVLCQVFINEMHSSSVNKKELVSLQNAKFSTDDFSFNMNPGLPKNNFEVVPAALSKCDNISNPNDDTGITMLPSILGEIGIGTTPADAANAIRGCNDFYKGFFKKIGSIKGINSYFASMSSVLDNDYEFRLFKQILSELNLKLVVESGCLKIKWENELNEGLFWFLVIFGVATSLAGVGLAVNNFVFTFSTALVIATKTAAILSSVSILAALVCLFILIWFTFNEGRGPYCAIKSPKVTQGREYVDKINLIRESNMEYTSPSTAVKSGSNEKEITGFELKN